MVDDLLLVHDPAENDILIGCAVDEVVQHVGDVVQHQRLCLLCYLKGVGVPAPIAVQENRVVQSTFEQLAGRCFPNAHRAADHI